MVSALFQALVDDGFTAYCCGPEDDPAAAVIAVFEWDDHLDVIVVPQDGPAAAARLAKPAEVLNPPPTAVWTWVGNPDGAIWALLGLAPPDHPDAPTEVVPTPAVLRVPRACTSVRTPPEGQSGVRADRLRRARDQRDISREFFSDLFDQVDSAAAIGAADNFTDDAELQFGNYPPMVGHTAIAEFVSTLFVLAAGVKHELYNFWELEDRTAFTNGMVTFTRHDGTELIVPFATVSQFNEYCTLLIRHQVYVDASGLLLPSASLPPA